MGYTTDFEGEFILNKKVDEATYKLLKGLATTRRMGRNVDPKYGVEGEFYVECTKNYGQDYDNPNVINSNCPPSTQPGLWCHWLIDEDRQTIQWDGGEKFYGYVEWLQYLIDKVLIPKGYTIKGRVTWEGEEREDIGTILVYDNSVDVTHGEHVRENSKEFIKRAGVSLALNLFMLAQVGSNWI